MTDSSINKQNRNRFRIIGGEWRSRKLGFPGDVPSLRPTADRIRETLFNWLQEKIGGAVCLDLFAGSGALSFEACSRGARSVTAVDSSPRVAAALRENCRLLDCSSMHIVTADAIEWLRDNAGKGRYDIIFLDPPFSADMLPECCRLLDAGDFAAPGAIIYLESGRPLETLALPAGWRLLRSKNAGQVFYGFCERSIQQAGA